MALDTVDEGVRITFWNASAERMLGYAAAEALDRPIDLIVPERMRESRGGLRHTAAEVLPGLAWGTAWRRSGLDGTAAA